MHTVIFAAGSVRPGRWVDEAIARAELVIAADRGAQTALTYGLTPRYIIGDLDSLKLSAQRLQELGCEVVRAQEEKDETDSELAFQLALEKGATSITLLGGWGGERLEHAIGNITLLVDITSVPVRLVDGPTACWIVRGPGRTEIEGQTGDLLSLFPLSGDARGVSTHNLYYALVDGCLRFGKPRGISNVLTDQHAEVTVESGILLVVHTRKDELHE
ncbi:thiamine diphosphokinase [Ktedonospora formicarum]|uniref:Thiamine diphosphokinase n=1 Tax=Ktedonospora formicarum TaxID=2778364 RepID=A0A8J3HTK0_9CHLR|nr:thiamine diphosphokinase [Ktedonospora formicarum]GHO43454.1 thiamine pyrophosphokinase [Ktedonospora formicarum]